MKVVCGCLSLFPTDAPVCLRPPMVNSKSSIIIHQSDGSFKDPILPLTDKTCCVHLRQPKPRSLKSCWNSAGYSFGCGHVKYPLNERANHAELKECLKFMKYWKKNKFWGTFSGWINFYGFARLHTNIGIDAPIWAAAAVLRRTWRNGSFKWKNTKGNFMTFIIAAQHLLM